MTNINNDTTSCKRSNSELDLLPVGWEKVKMGEVTDFITDGTHSTPKYVEEGIPFYSVENISNDDFVNTKFITKEEHELLLKRCELKKNDIIMSRITAGVLGDTKLIDWDVEASIYVSLALIRCNKKVDVNYLYNYTKSSFFLKEVRKRALLIATPMKINLNEIAKLNLAIPNSLNEQVKIAEILTTQRNIIRLKKVCLEEKEKENKHVIQILMSPGKEYFRRTIKDGVEWEEKRLGSLSDIATGNKDVVDKVDNGRYPFFVRSQKVEAINSYSYDGEAILIPGDGRIGEIYHYVEGKFDYHQRVYKVSDFSNEVYGKYIYYYMKVHFKKEAMKYSAKATVDSLRRPMLMEMCIKYPKNKLEQKRIIDILDASFKEIELIKEEIICQELKHKALMQLLLTGKIRVVI